MSSGTIVQHSTKTPATESHHTTLVTFGVDHDVYGVPMDCVQEVIPLPALVTLPSCPDLIEGFLNLSGTVVPVIRLDQLLGVSRAEDHLFTPLIILRCGDTLLALLVHRVIGIVPVDETSIMPISRGETINDFAQGMMTTSDATLIVLDTDRLLLKQELVRLNELKEQAERRIAQWEDDVP